MVRPLRRSIRARMACALLAAFAATLTHGAAAAFAQALTPSMEPTRSVVVTGAAGYDLDFTLPTAAKAGCMVCHGDPNLTRMRGGVLVSYFVDPATIDSSAHAGVQCTGCHMDFAFTLPHVTAGTDWRSTARSACKNCHEDQFYLYGRGVHKGDAPNGKPADPDAPAKPLCGDCHGGHDIPPLTDNPKGRLQMHADGWETCGRCHTDYWDSYDDYYHGAAYKLGAEDAPACWDCHDAHDIFPSDDQQSSLGERHLEETCSRCHRDPGGDYLEYARFVHGREEVNETVPLRGWLLGFIDMVRGWFGG